MFRDREEEPDVRPIILLTIALTLAAASPTAAATFHRTRIAPDLGLDALTRGVAREQVGRDVFANPYAAVTLGRVDVYPVFPYVEARSFEVVSDPRWNRLVYGEAGRTLRAYDGAGTALGRLSEPRGLAVDERHRLYVADTGNDRIVVLDASTEFGDLQLVPAFEIRGLSGPYGVAYSDGGTPFVAGDDFLYVTDTGRNRVALYSLEPSGAVLRGAIGELGSGPGRFAGPMAVAAGRTAAGHTRDLYVADAHTRRLVRLSHDGRVLHWEADVTVEADVVTSLDTDQWGNLYAAAPRRGVVQKFNAALEPVAELREGLSQPRAFHVPFVTVSDHRAGTTERVGRASGLAVEQWDDGHGIQLWDLGLEVTAPVLAPGSSEARFHLTDRADVTLEVLDAATGRSLARQPAGALDAGAHAIPLGAAAAVLAGGERILRVSAVSAYAEGPTVSAQSRFGQGGVSDIGLLGHWPNPAGARTRIDLALPSGSDPSSLAIFDASGRQVRLLGTRFAPGVQQVIWDGANDRGQEVPAGVYFYRLQAGSRSWTHKLVMVR